MKTGLAVLAAFLICLQSAGGHQDYLGDVHPTVRVEKGNFAVYFRNNEEKLSFKTVVDPGGRVVSERKPSPPPPGPGIETVQDHFALVEACHDAYYAVPPYSRTHKGKPFLLRIVGETTEKIEPRWGEEKIGLVHAVAVTEDRFLFVASALEAGTHRCASQFAFHVFSRATGEKLQSRDIGHPVRIYDFPLSSRVVVRGTWAYIAWMKGAGAGSSLLLSRLDLASGSLEEEELGPGEGNTSVSMENLGKALLVAFHRPEKAVVRGQETRRARIALVWVDLETAFRSKAARRPGAGEDSGTERPDH